MQAMIIGAGGFAGTYLVDEIRKTLFCDVVTTTSKPDKPLNIGEDKTAFLDIQNYGQIKAVLESEKPDYIFHLAAQSSVALSWMNPQKTVDVNIIGAINLINAIRELDYSPRVLIVGSGEEYGRVADVPINEGTPLNPGNVYAVTKVCQNMMATIYAKAYGLGLIVTRSFNHIGPKQSPQFVVADFCSQVAKIEADLQEPVIRVGNLTAKRDFTDVRDVVRAYCKLIQYGKPGETYNVGSGHAISIQEILNRILEQSTQKINVEINQNKLRPVDVPVIEADVSKIYRDTGWRPEISLDKTISDTLRYWRKEYAQ